MTEEWKDIKGYEGFYQISSFGRVKSLYFKKEKILKPHITKGFYHWGYCDQKKRRGEI